MRNRRCYADGPIQLDLKYVSAHARFRLREVDLHHSYSFQSDDKAIIFAGRKSTADHISSEFAMQGVSVQCLHGDREQSDREQALKDLKTGDVRILIATGL